MVRRLAVVAAAAALTMGLLAPTPASAEIDTDHGWDYRAMGIGGDYQVLRGQFAGDSAADLLFYAPGSRSRLAVDRPGGRNGVPTPSHGRPSPSTAPTCRWSATSVATTTATSCSTAGAPTPTSLWTSVEDPAAPFRSKPVSISGTNYQPKVLFDYRDPGGQGRRAVPGARHRAPDYLWHFTDSVGTEDYVGPGTWTSRTLRGQRLLPAGRGRLERRLPRRRRALPARHRPRTTSGSAPPRGRLHPDGTCRSTAPTSPSTIRRHDDVRRHLLVGQRRHQRGLLDLRNGTSVVSPAVRRRAAAVADRQDHRGRRQRRRLIQSDAERRCRGLRPTTPGGQLRAGRQTTTTFTTAWRAITGDYDGDGWAQTCSGTAPAPADRFQILVRPWST